ncbi:MAG TPA: hypothetical protein VGD42_16290 [Lysobacter sp.]
MDLDAWADAYVEFHAIDRTLDAQDPLWWAVERSMFVIRQDAADEMWQFILAVLARRPSERVLRMLAAGPLEDLLAYAGKFYIDRVELEARRNPAFRHLLGGVWQNRTPDELWRRVEAVRGEPW